MAGWRLGSIRSRTSCWCSNGIVLRLEGREIETTGLKAMLDRHERWLGELGRHVAELENSPRD